MEVGRAERGIGAVVDAGREARRDVHGAAQRDHEVREIAAHALPVTSVSTAAVLPSELFETNSTWPLHPVADGLHAAIALLEAAEFGECEAVQAVGLAIAAGVEVGQHVGRQLGDRYLGQGFRRRPVMHEIDHRFAVDPQGPLRRHAAAGTWNWWRRR